MRTLRLTIAYDGTRYAGWQRQQARPSQARYASRDTRNAVETIQETVERALARILRERVSVVASGRTDAGVHAEAQVAHARTSSPIPVERLRRGLNHLLPPDIAVLRVENAPPGFHARFDAVRKRYRYRLFTGEVVPPFIRPYVHHVRVPLDVALMRREAAGLKGRRDFRAFAHVPAREGHGRAGTRTIHTVHLRRRGQEVRLELEGNGFLHHMVRRIAGTLIDIGRGHLPAGTVAALLRRRGSARSGPTAPAHGLVLVRVTYPRRRVVRQH